MSDIEDHNSLPEDELIAAEYALGVLDGPERAAAERRIAREAGFARMVVGVGRAAGASGPRKSRRSLHHRTSGTALPPSCHRNVRKALAFGRISSSGAGSH